MVITLLTKIALLNRVEVLVYMCQTILILEFILEFFIEISRPHEGNVIVGIIIYRPPNQNVNDFGIRMDNVLGKTTRGYKICYLMGDLNLNLLNNQNHNATREFLDGLYSHLFFPLITLPS